MHGPCMRCMANLCSWLPYDCRRCRPARRRTTINDDTEGEEGSSSATLICRPPAGSEPGGVSKFNLVCACCIVELKFPIEIEVHARDARGCCCCCCAALHADRGTYARTHETERKHVGSGGAVHECHASIPIRSILRGRQGSRFGARRGPTGLCELQLQSRIGSEQSRLAMQRRRQCTYMLYVRA